MSNTMYSIKATKAANGGNDYIFTGAIGTASFNTKNGDSGASLKCSTRQQTIVEAFNKLKNPEKMALLADLTVLKSTAESSNTATGNLSSGLYYSSPSDPIGKACTQAGF